MARRTGRLGEPGWQPKRPFTELRVHGVGNTPLEEILDDPHPVQVAGDNMAGFYRRSDAGSDVADPDSQPVTDEGALTDLGDLEAYDWGGFNTGGGWKAFWPLLLPFTLVNVSGWMAIHKSKLGQRSIRLFGLALSMLLVTWIGAFVIDAIALQCGSQPACLDRQWWLKPFEWFANNPAQRIAITLIIPLGVTWLLWYWPGRRRQDRYERFTGHSEPLEVPQGSDISLADPSIWHSEVSTSAHLHAAAILSLLASGVSWALWTSQKVAVDLALGVLGSSLVVVMVVVVVWFNDSESGDGSGPLHHSDSSALARWLLGAAVVYTATTLVMLFVGDRNFAEEVDYLALNPDVEQLVADSAGKLAEIEGIIDPLYMHTRVSALLIILASVGVLLHQFLGRLDSRRTRQRPPRGKRMLSGWTPLAANMMALVLVLMMIVSGGVWLTEVLGDRPEELLETSGVDRGTCQEQVPETPTEAFEVCALLPGGDVKVRAALSAALAQYPMVLHGESVTAVVLLASEVSDDGQVAVPGMLSESPKAHLPLIAALVSVTDDTAALRFEPLIELRIGYDLYAATLLGMLLLLVVGAGLIFLSVWYRIRPRHYPVRNKLRIGAERKFEEGRRSPREQEHWVKVGVGELRKSPRNTRLPRLLLIPLAGVPIAIVVTLIRPVLPVMHRELVRHAPWTITLSSFVFPLAAVAFAGFLAKARSSNVGGPFGGMWDTITYWPRAYHPFAVPSYNVRAVPELAQRIKTLTQRPEQRLLLTAHSGGVVIVLAALLQIPQENRSKVALLTYGNPVGALHSQAWPEYFDAGELMKIALLLGETDDDGAVKEIRWKNLWRLTDWTGGYAFGDASDRFQHPERGFERPIVHSGRSVTWKAQPVTVGDIESLQYDPSIESVARSLSNDPVAAAIGHTDYFHDPKRRGPEDTRYQDARLILVKSLGFGSES